MASGEEAKHLEEPTAKHSYGAIPKIRSSTEPKRRTDTGNTTFIASAPAVLEPSKDVPRPPKEQKRTIEDSNSPPVNPWRTLVTVSCPEQSTCVVMVPGDASNDRAAEQQSLHEQSNEHVTICSSFLQGYKNCTSELRKSRFIYFFQAVLSLISLSAVVMGLLFKTSCRESPLLPVFSFITGLMGVVLSGLWMSTTSYQRRGRQTSAGCMAALVLLSSAFFLFTITEMCVLGTMSPNFDDEYALNYCDETFYYFSQYQQVAIGVVAVFPLILHLPVCLQILRGNGANRNVQ
ncbi:uncharacterized protein LOC129957327 [Argiope bruennichi]|uniref:uncharacterized protein LOC129957327 n=1 Tax=Argiope bruennichi TaxID=94029 RepID=UPI00249402CF|nr:uncharacterized protein LOC129957327 [Argiope bruennichi]